MGLTVYKIDGSPPVRSVFMVIEALNIPDVEFVDVNLMEGEHLQEEYLKEPVFFWGEKSFRPENLAKINKAYEFTEKFLSSPWLAGDEITLADICCVSTLSSMNVVMPIDDNLFPNLSDWLKRCSQQEFYVKGNEPGLELFRGLAKMKLG